MQAVRHVLGWATAALFLLFCWLAPLRPIVAVSEEKPVIKTPSEGLRERLVDAEVRYGDTQCKEWTGNRWKCNHRDWEWVGRYHGVSMTDGAPQARACIWAHPKRNRPLTVAYHDVVLDDAVFGEVALLDSSRPGQNVNFSVRINGVVKRRVTLTDKRAGWQRWHVNTGDQRGEKATVTVEIRANQPDWRHVCFTGALGALPK